VPVDLIMLMQEHIRKQQHQLQSLQHETAELRAYFAHLQVFSVVCYDTHLVVAYIPSIFVQSEASHFHDLRLQHQHEEFEFQNVHREMEVCMVWQSLSPTCL
jgi:hypothetical protein